jgi:iron complex outermembrane recepter protein
VNGVVTDISNRDLRRAPDLSAAIGADYVIPIGAGELALGASFRHVSKLQTTIVGSPTDPTVNDPRGPRPGPQPAGCQRCLHIRSGGAQLSASIFGRNLTDDRGLSSTLPVGGLFTFSAARPPRTWGVELGIEF